MFKPPLTQTSPPSTVTFGDHHPAPASPEKDLASPEKDLAVETGEATGHLLGAHLESPARVAALAVETGEATAVGPLVSPARAAALAVETGEAGPPVSLERASPVSALEASPERAARVDRGEAGPLVSPEKDLAVETGVTIGLLLGGDLDLESRVRAAPAEEIGEAAAALESRVRADPADGDPLESQARDHLESQARVMAPADGDHLESPVRADPAEEIGEAAAALESLERVVAPVTLET
jgi:HAMP domain-containing protein